MPSVHSSAGVYVNEVDLSQRIQAVSSSIAAIVGESNRGPVNTTKLITSSKQFLETFGKPDASLTYMHYCALAFLEEGNRLYVTRVAPNSLYGGLVVSVNNNLNEINPIASGLSDPEAYPFATSDLFLVYANNPGKWNSEISVQVYPNTKLSDNSFYLDVYLQGINQPVERFLVHMDLVIDGYGVQLNVEQNINSKSQYIKIKQNLDNPDYITNPKRQYINSLSVGSLNGGANGTKATDSDIINAWNLYTDVEIIDINILINGGYTSVPVQRHIDAICSSRMDCIAILDVPSDKQKPQDAINYRRIELMLDSSYSALYSPDNYILDQYSDRRLYVPPSGHVAAAYARTDREAELWFAPAGMNRGKLNVLGVRHTYNQGDRDALVESQVNGTRVIAGSGIKIWAADTLQTMASALSNVSVRRLMIFLEKSISLAVLYSVFDPNDSVLRARLTELCERFLRPIKDARGLYDFTVVCEDSNNPPEIVAAGDLNLDIYIDPVLPAKRIHLTAIVQKTGAKFSISNV